MNTNTVFFKDNFSISTRKTCTLHIFNPPCFVFVVTSSQKHECIVAGLRTNCWITSELFLKASSEILTINTRNSIEDASIQDVGVPKDLGVVSKTCLNVGIE